MLTDILGHPIKAGTLVLTKSYWSTTMNKLVTIDRVTEKAVYVTLDATWYDFKTGQRIHAKKSVRRRPDQVVAISKQIEHNRKKYPENMI